MASRPKIDAKRLRRDAAKAEKERPLPSIGRETIGIVRAIRDLMPTIRDLRTQGVRWAAIAEALTAQGIYPDQDGKPVPLTANRLTAIIANIERQEARKAQRMAQRAARPDLVAPKVAKTSRKSVALAKELQPDVKASSDMPETYASEEDLRRQAYAGVQRFMKD